ncbi:acetyltransferase [Myxococcota bacterium]|nr:acetyltransferase [Myxococcota bacterium]MBU1536260.1 acetyltransferase [Myxococcota bacterium]
MPGEYPSVVIYGTGGHAKVVREIFAMKTIPVAGFMDPSAEKRGSMFLSRPVFGSEKLLEKGKYPFDVAIIAVGKCKVRQEMGELFESYRIPLVSAVHPAATVSPFASLGPGSVVAAGAVLSPGVKLGKSCIINTNAVVDYDTVLDSWAQIAPGAILCGGVTIGECTWIGAGATVIEGVTIGANTMVGAGAVVTRDLPDNVLAVGVPARIIDSWPVKGQRLVPPRQW